jgi:hypothetical protein
MGGEPTPDAVWKLLDRELGLGDGCGLGVMDAGWVEQRLRPVCTPDFVYERRRRLDTGLPPLDRDAYLQIMSDMIDIMGTIQVTTSLVAVRGERLVVTRIVFTNEDGDEIAALQVWQASPDLAHLERGAVFEPENEAIAIAELDRLHAELGGD